MEGLDLDLDLDLRSKDQCDVDLDLDLDLDLRSKDQRRLDLVLDLDLRSKDQNRLDQLIWLIFVLGCIGVDTEWSLTNNLLQMFLSMPLQKRRTSQHRLQRGMGPPSSPRSSTVIMKTRRQCLSRLHLQRPAHDVQSANMVSDSSLFGTVVLGLGY